MIYFENYIPVLKERFIWFIHSKPELSKGDLILFQISQNKKKMIRLKRKCEIVDFKSSQKNHQSFIFHFSKKKSSCHQNALALSQ